MSEIGVRVFRWVAWHLPREVVYWSLIRGGVNASRGEWRNEEVPALKLSDVLARWDRGR